MKHKTCVRYIGLVVVLSLMSACGGGSNSRNETDALGVDLNEKHDIAIQGDSAKVIEIAAKTYRIEIEGVYPTALAFSESPGREAYEVPTEIVGLWDRMFPEGMPNSVFYGRTAEGTSVAAFQIDKPIYNIENKSLIFDARLIGDSPGLPSELHDVDLLIDPTLGQWISIAINCGGTVLSLIPAILTGGSTAPLTAIASAACVVALVDAGIGHLPEFH
jgi:hypothetical protein